jgi:tetratricopeptide (TPR) repeat protein
VTVRKKALELKNDYTDPANKFWYAEATAEFWRLLDDTKQYDLAAREFRALAEREPANVDYLYYLGNAYNKLESYEQAAEAFGKGVDLRPDDWPLHGDFLTATKRVAGLKAAVSRYEDLLLKHPDHLAVQTRLASLYLEDQQKDKASPLLQRAKRNSALTDLKRIKDTNFQNLRIALAHALNKVGEHADAAVQFAQVLASIPRIYENEGLIVTFTIECGKSLVRANRVEEGIKKLEEARVAHRLYFPDQREPLALLFELGLAHWELGKKDKARRAEEAEMYFRKYLQELRAGTVGTVRNSQDVEIAERLGDLYLEVPDYRKAAEVFKQALDLIDVAVDKEKCPTGRVQFKYVQALHGQGAWEACILVAKDLVGDKEYGPKSRELLARAYIENRQPVQAIEQLGELKGTPRWNDEALLLMGQALLASNPPRPEEALTFIEEAFNKRPGDEKTALEYAQVLRYLDRADEARALYQKILKTRPRSAKAMIGLGDLELRLAKGAAGKERADHIAQAVKHYKEARYLGQTTEVLDKTSQAERELAVAEADLQAQSDRLRLVLYTGGLILAALLPIGFMVYFYRRQWAMRCFREVCDLERDLIQLIRGRVEAYWNGAWERLAEEPFRGRVDFKSLRNRAEKEGAKDILGVANFGHLVGIIDAGWEVLGLNDLCAPEMVDPKEVIIANLSYIGSCRVCLAHVGKLEELTAKHISRRRLNDGTFKAHVSKHLHRQVKTSLKIIRTKFNVTPEAADLPTLAPVTMNRDSVTRGRPGNSAS